MARARKWPKRDADAELHWSPSLQRASREKVHAAAIRQLAAGQACSPELAAVLLESSDETNRRFVPQLICECVGLVERDW